MTDALTKPVWVWLPAATTPVPCGVFTLRGQVGDFLYSDDYKRLQGLTLDPVVLPMTRRATPLKETRQQGVFGVFRDTMPDGYGLALLEQLRGVGLSHPMDRMEASIGDATGAIEVCESIQDKVDYRPVFAQDLINTLAGLSPTQPSSVAVRSVHGIFGTSLGGQRPKMTVDMHGQYWIAKLQDRGDEPDMPLREYLAMRVASRLGIDVANVEFLRCGDHQVVFVERFDRRVHDHGIQRFMYASAHTILRLDAQLPGDPKRSYLGFSKALRRWIPGQGYGPEIWKRMAYNAICGNTDDHPRNHGVVHDGQAWKLAPAFDIAPSTHLPRAQAIVQAMSINRAGSLISHRENLLSSCEEFGVDRAEADQFLDHARDQFAQLWREEAERVGEDASRIAPHVWGEQANCAKPMRSGAFVRGHITPEQNTQMLGMHRQLMQKGNHTAQAYAKARLEQSAGPVAPDGVQKKMQFGVGKLDVAGASSPAASGGPGED